MNKHKLPHGLTEVEFKLVVEVISLLAQWRNEKSRKMRSQKNTQVDCSNSKNTTQPLCGDDKHSSSVRSETEDEPKIKEPT